MASTIPKGLPFILYLIGFRPGYRGDLLLAALGLILTVTGTTTAGMLPGFLPSLVTAAIIMYHRGKILDPSSPLRGYIKAIRVGAIPIGVVVPYVIASFYNPLAAIPVVLLGLAMEDVWSLLDRFDLYPAATVRRYTLIALYPVRRRELLAIILAVSIPSLIAYAVTRLELLLVYPLLAYLMIIYSVVLLPEYVATTPSGPSALDELAARLPTLRFIYVTFFARKRMRDLGRKAGYVRGRYDLFISKMATYFAASVYLSLVVTPLLYTILRNPVILIIPFLIAAIMLLAPVVIFTSKRGSRARNIALRLPLITSYFAAMLAAGESITSAMERILENRGLGKMFGLTDESRIYMEYYSVIHSEEEAVERYTESVPEDRYRYLLKTIETILTREGSGAAFDAAVRRLRDITLSAIDNARSIVNDVVMPMVAVLVIPVVFVPFAAAFTEFTLLPVAIGITALLLGGFMYLTLASTIPELPSEYPNYKPRLRRGTVIFVLTGIILTLLTAKLQPDIILYAFPALVIAAAAAASSYAVRYDISLNEEIMSKLPDILVAFASGIARTGSVEVTLDEISATLDLTPRLRKTLTTIASIFASNPDRINYNGVFWYKYLLFVLSVASTHGIAPVKLFSAISEFVNEYKRFIATINASFRSLRIIFILSMILLATSVGIVVGYIEAFQPVLEYTAQAPTTIVLPVPAVQPEELESVMTYSKAALIYSAVIFGVVASSTNTLRDAKWVTIFVVMAILLTVVADYTRTFITGATA